MPEDVMEPLKEVLLSGFIGQGSKVNEFENALAEKLGTKNVLTVNSGTSGLHLALRLAGVGYGDEVITTALTCTATNWPILANGAIPIWADIDKDTGNIDWRSIESLITNKTKAIMVVHWGGYPVDLDEIMDIAKKYNLKVIADCAHGFGSTYKNKPVGTVADFGIYSFQAIKHMTTVDGGLLVVKDNDDYERGKLLRWYGIDRDGKRADFRCESDILEWGYKFHMNDIAATIGLVQLKYVNKTIEKHRENAKFYNEKLSDVPGITLLSEKIDRQSSYWIYTLKVENRDSFMTKMLESGIATSRVHERNDKHTCVAVYQKELPILDEFVKKMICIPVGWWVTEEDRNYIVDIIKRGW
ncbi:MAG: DegT/DnrJ/EryC1/StrS family aminotransferase [Candidatus Falkowbacteria bacterium]|nr:DegT/DnrJ/EryC1/StrS family aminotransferase [Candidatus Falkowbacteria bacterium]